MKILGAEFMDWYDNYWPGPEWCIEEEEIKTHDINGRWLLVPHEKYDVGLFGFLYWQGADGNDPTEGTGLSIESCIKKWQHERDFDFQVVKVPRNKVASE